ncbi:hypothetical protein P154DRAFT_569360 [Amniculicola lignicola CBS 123094]|uniref:FAD-binding FR-type domain-containing protein n=1 Tax=Amniculicola lignicola CBS 123094 TaxID=1392246 RepID=A0A6A5X3J4_9PLEO|nr:hypothetical protein P154DRAFT_569360 [Amniculicola lignicola CBS 123094]
MGVLTVPRILAVWFFECLIRVVRLTVNGMQRSIITNIGDHHVRIDVLSIRTSGKPGKHIYVYFPTLNPLFPWQNRPFSVCSTALLPAKRHLSNPGNSLPADSGADVETNNRTVKGSPVHDNTPSAGGITLYVRKSTGLSKPLQTHGGLLTLLDGPYRNNDPDEVLKCDRLLLLAGGIGIIGTLVFLHAHPTVKIAFSLKREHEAVLQDLMPMFNGIESDIQVGERLNLTGVLHQEADNGYVKVEVVACGLGEFVDTVRAEVAKLGRRSKTTLVAGFFGQKFTGKNDHFELFIQRSALYIDESDSPPESPSPRPQLEIES